MTILGIDLPVAGPEELTDALLLRFVHNETTPDEDNLLVSLGICWRHAIKGEWLVCLAPAGQKRWVSLSASAERLQRSAELSLPRSLCQCHADRFSSHEE